MTQENLPVQFRIAGIGNPQFAILNQKPNLEEEINFNLQVNFGGNLTKRHIWCSSNVDATQNGNILLVIEVTCIFQLPDESWEQLFNVDENQLILPKDAATHFAVLTIGTLRGVLFAKTEGTVYTAYPLPPFNITETLQHDIVLNFTPDTLSNF